MISELLMAAAVFAYANGLLLAIIDNGRPASRGDVGILLYMGLAFSLVSVVLAYV